MEIGLPTTDELTQCAEEAFQEAYVTHITAGGARADRTDDARNIAKKLLAALRAAYGDAWNVEVLLHAVRQMTAFASVVQGGMPGAPKSYLSVSTVFAAITAEFSDAIEFTILNWSFFAIVRAIHRSVASRLILTGEAKREARKGLSEFLGSCAERFRLTIVDLNYDTLAD